MLDMLQNGPRLFCDGLEAIGGSCSKTILAINVWQLILIVLIFGLVTAIAYFVRRYNRLDQFSNLLEMTTPYGAVPEARTIRVNPHDLARALGKRGLYDLNKGDAAKKLNEKYGGRYFVVEIYEGGRRLLSKELKVVAWWHRLKPTEFQADPETLDLIKAGSESPLDDDLGDTYGADGRFDIYFRPVKWWDLRHWLNHPAREIRLAIYVAIFAAALEYSSDVIEFLRTLFKTP